MCSLGNKQIWGGKWLTNEKGFCWLAGQIKTDKVFKKVIADGMKISKTEP
jgi:hypothetical protein